MKRFLFRFVLLLAAVLVLGGVQYQIEQAAQGLEEDLQGAVGDLFKKKD